eukprot:CAMPEP_0174985802 /NCGR_PEP_ID=MMETSP0004_2-20121128/18558_1 /TAXON_ID=420556 /ORGANISM="Ochromonas sp., Strain CCMP1393" /LENGTH=45 /DNA_ID= /DNA_START= /DNA_END= /DNA_ORIENTATION=
MVGNITPISTTHATTIVAIAAGAGGGCYIRIVRSITNMPSLPGGW